MSRLAWTLALGAFLLAAGLIVFQPSSSSARAKLVLPNEDIDSEGLGQIINLDLNRMSRLLPIDTALRFTSSEAVKMTLNKVGRDSSSRAVEAMLPKLRSRLVPGTNTVEIQISHTDPDFAVRFARAWIVATNELRNESENALVDRLAGNLQREAARIRSDLVALYAETQGGRAAVPLSYLVLLEGNSRELSRIHLERQQLESELSLMRPDDAQSDGLANIRSQRSSIDRVTAGGDVAARRVEAEAKLASSSKTYGPNSPKVLQAEAEFTARQDDLRDSNAGQRLLLEARLAAFNRDIEQLRLEMTDNLRKIDAGLAMQLSPAFLRQSKEIEILEKQLESVESRSRELSVYRQTPRNSLLVLDPPYLSKSLQSRYLALIIAAVGSALIGASVSLLTQRQAPGFW